MTMDEIIKQREILNEELKIALSTMERSDKIQNIRQKIIINQQQCPHYSNKYNWAIINNKCPYCGFVFDYGRKY